MKAMVVRASKYNYMFKQMSLHRMEGLQLNSDLWLERFIKIIGIIALIVIHVGLPNQH